MKQESGYAMRCRGLEWTLMWGKSEVGAGVCNEVQGIGVDIDVGTGAYAMRWRGLE